MKIINFFSLVLISLLLILVPFESVSADEERSLDPEDLERTLYSFQSYQGDKWYFDAIDTPNSNNTGANVTIAILDTGVTKTSQLACHNFVNEYDAFWDISGPGSARDVGSHGTLVAHTIADCDIGIAKSVNIMPVRIFTDYFASYGYPIYTDDLAVAMGIVWAVDNGADIINMSFGASCFTTWDGGCKGETGTFAGYVDGAIKYAYDNGVLLLAASGNDALPWVSYPANNPYVWAIGAVNSSLNKASFSNFGTSLDFVAPGENIGTALGAVDGTSFSSPEVAAAAAVLKGSMPGLTVEEIEGAFICTVVDLGDAGWDPEYGWGMIQIEASLDLLNAGLLQTPWFPTPSLTLISEGQGKIKAMWQPADDCNDIESYSLYKNGDFINSFSKNQTEGYITVTESGTYNLSVKATNVFSNNTELITSSIDIDLTPPQWNEGSSISIVQQGDNLLYSWPSAEDSSGISNYALRVERDGELVIQENTISTSLSFSLGYFENPGTYSVSLKVFDEFNNENELSTGFIIEDTSTTTTSTTTTTTTTIPTSEEDNSSTTTTSTTTTTLPSFNSVTTTTTIPVFDTTTTTTVPITVTASTSSELVGCISNSQIGESAVRLWITNTTSLDAYFDVRYSTNSGSTWTDLRDGEFISSSAAYMFLTPNLPNNTRVQWQWRGGLENPNSGNYSYGPSITVSGCPVDNSSSPTTSSTTSTTTTTADVIGPNWSSVADQIQVTNRTSDSITVNWPEPYDYSPIANYFVYLDGNLVSTKSSSTRNHTFNNLNPGFQYNIVIQASDIVGNTSSNGPNININTLARTTAVLTSFSFTGNSSYEYTPDGSTTLPFSFTTSPGSSGVTPSVRIQFIRDGGGTVERDLGNSSPVTVPFSGTAGNWRINWIYVMDEGAYKTYYYADGSVSVSPSDAQPANGATTHNLFNNNTLFTVNAPPVTTPVVDAFTFTGNSNYDYTPDNSIQIPFSYSATPGSSGIISRLQVKLVSSSGSSVDRELINGTITVSSGSASTGGDWSISWIYVMDEGGNKTYYYADGSVSQSPGDLSNINNITTHNLFNNATIFTVNAAPLTTPVVNSFSFTGNSSYEYTPDGSTTLPFSFTTSPGSSGKISGITVRLQRAGGGSTTRNLGGGNGYSSPFETSDTVPFSGTAGEWSIGWIYIQDDGGNKTYYYADGSVSQNPGSLNNVNGITSHNLFSSGTIFTVVDPPTISANTSSELVGCLTGDDAGKSKVRLWVTNTTGVDAYFDVQYSTNNGSSWTTLGDGEFISNGAAYMFITSQYSNGTNVIWQWRGATSNPSSGSFTSGASITISGC